MAIPTPLAPALVLALTLAASVYVRAPLDIVCTVVGALIVAWLSITVAIRRRKVG